MCQTAVSLGEALRLARNAVGREDLICITGSFYLIGQAKTRFSSDSGQQKARNSAGSAKLKYNKLIDEAL